MNSTEQSSRQYRLARLAFMLTAAGGLTILLGFPAMVRAKVCPTRFTLTQLTQLRWATDAQISPSGKEVAFVERSFDFKHNSSKSGVWVVGQDGSQLHRVSKSGTRASSPHWSPDGSRLLYVASAAKKKKGERKGKGKKQKSKIMVWRVKAQASTLLVTLKHRPSELAWSPDGRHIAFAMFVPSQPTGSIAHMPPKPEGAKWGPPIMVVSRLDYRSNGAGYLPHGHTQLFEMSSSGGTPKQLTSGNYDNGAGFGGGGLVWSRDGKYLIFAANRDRPAAYHPEGRRLYEVAVAGGTPHALLKGKSKGPEGSPAVSPDGQKIAYTGSDYRTHSFHNQTHLYVMNRDGSHSHLAIAHFDRDIRNPQWGANGKKLYFQYEDGGITRLAYVTLSSGKVTRVAKIPSGGIDTPYAFGQYSLAPATGAFAFTLSTPEHPADVAIGHQGRGKAKIVRLTHLNRKVLGQDTLGKLHVIHFPSSYDHRMIEGWVLRPPNFDLAHKYPLVLQIHGGPTSSYGPVFSAEDQFYAALGYIVLYANARGSTSYGQEFAEGNNIGFPNNRDYADLMSAVSAVIADGHVDKHRLYVTGGSAGGAFTAWIVGHTDRFRAAAAVKPVINWYSLLLTADIGPATMKDWMVGDVWNHPKFYMKHSPISYVGNVKTPTMLIHGEVDYRAPGASATQFYRALKIRKVPTVLVRIPGASHEISAKPRNLVAKIAYIAGWFACYGGQSVGSHSCPYPTGGSN